jgi:hypothetical protein
MQVSVLKTDNGPHPPEKWARITAWMLVNHLIEVDENSASKLAIEVREARDQLEQKFYAVLKEYHATVQDGERAAIVSQGLDRLASGDRDEAIADHVDLDRCVQAVVDEAKIHPVLFAHFSRDEVRAVVRERLAMDFGSVIDIERDWRANGYIVADGVAVQDRAHQASHPAVVAWHTRRHPGAPLT